MIARDPSVWRAARMRSCTSSGAAPRMRVGSGTCTRAIDVLRLPTILCRVPVDKDPTLIRRTAIPEGLRVLPDGSWRVGDQAVAHARSLRYFKQRLTFEEGGAFVVDGAQRMPITIEGPPFQIESLTFDADKNELRAQ